MKVFSPRALEFACRSKACAPPPVGSGGSSSKGMTPAGLVKAGWQKSGTGVHAKYRKGDYVIEKSGGMIGGYNAFHVGGSGPEYRSTIGGRKARNLRQRDTLDGVLKAVTDHASGL